MNDLSIIEKTQTSMLIFVLIHKIWKNSFQNSLPTQEKKWFHFICVYYTMLDEFVIIIHTFISSNKDTKTFLYIQFIFFS